MNTFGFQSSLFYGWFYGWVLWMGGLVVTRYFMNTFGFEYTVVSFLWMVRGIKVWGLVLENADALATLAPFVLEYMCISNVATYGIIC